MIKACGLLVLCWISGRVNPPSARTKPMRDNTTDDVDKQRPYEPIWSVSMMRFVRSIMATSGLLSVRAPCSWDDRNARCPALGAAFLAWVSRRLVPDNQCQPKVCPAPMQPTCSSMVPDSGPASCASCSALLGPLFLLPSRGSQISWVHSPRVSGASGPWGHQPYGVSGY